MSTTKKPWIYRPKYQLETSGCNVSIDLKNYATKDDLNKKVKEATGVDTTLLVEKTQYEKDKKDIKDDISKLKTGTNIDLTPYLLKTTYQKDKDLFTKENEIKSFICY